MNLDDVECGQFVRTSHSPTSARSVLASHPALRTPAGALPRGDAALLWGIWRLGYDRRGWIYAIVTAWIVLPICFLWRPGVQCQLGKGTVLQRAARRASGHLPSGIHACTPAARVSTHALGARHLGPQPGSQMIEARILRG
jgi:hypothetical protein